MSLTDALNLVSADRAAALALELVAVESPTGDTAAVSDLLAQRLRQLGMDVALHTAFPRTPVVIGRLQGSGPGPTLILNGHLDTVPIPHAAPERREGRVYGRGAIDMKGPIAAAVEAVRAAVESGLELHGDVILCAHGLHEAPGGHAEDLIAALEQGVLTGDAALVLEVGHDALPVAGLGSGIYRAHFRRATGVTHELMTPAGTPHPAAALSEAITVILELNNRLAEAPLEHIGPESVFIGQVHCGDFFNRFPNHSWIEGTRRYGPDATAAEAAAELRALLEPIANRHGLAFELEFEKVRDGFRVPLEHPLVDALRSAYLAETDRPLPITGIKIVADAPVFEKVGRIPCLYHGLDGFGAHGDVEWVAEAELLRAARVYLRTLAAYLGPR
jgi:acetylornithine deacetylase/succinyl-diaminopimelate desuccinylase-like protein